MAEVIRRSSRRAKKTNFSYSVGDLVEISKDQTVTTGRLVTKLMDAPAPRWLVAFDDESWPEEDMAADELGPVIGKIDSKQQTTLVQSPEVSVSSQEDTATAPHNKKRKSVTFENASDSSETKAAAAKARQQRSQRRQAKVDEDVVKNPHKPSVPIAANNKKIKTKNDDVIRVTMLTGTLLLYRGKHRRAEFIRRV